MFKLNPNLRSFWETQKPNKILRGGRSSGKTHDAAGVSVFLARNYSLRFLCVRQFQNRIADSVYTVLSEKISAAKWDDEFDVGVSSIRHKTTGSEFLFYGIARNLKEIKGTEGVDVLWIEEGESLTKDQWRIIEPTIRKENSEIWLIYNPHLTTDFVEAELPGMLGDSCIIRTINYPENPFLSRKQLTTIERLKQTDYEEYEHVYLGVPLTNDKRAIIKASWLDAAVDAHVTLGINMSGAMTTGYDVADDGEDMNAVVRFNGAVCEFAEEWKGGEDQLKQSALYAWGLAKDGLLLYDSVGVGAHTGSTLSDVPAAANKYFRFNAGESVRHPTRVYGDTGIKNRDKFENLKAQAWQMVADRFRNTYDAIKNGTEYPPDQLISIRSDCPLLTRLKTELSTPLKAISNRGLDMVESKKDLQKRSIKSPNLADAFIMAATTGLADLSDYVLDNL